MSNYMNRGGVAGSVGSSTSGASTCIAREASPLPSRQSLLSELYK